MTKAIFFDVDGTLVSFKTHQISPAVRQALQALRERGSSCSCPLGGTSPCWIRCDRSLTSTAM